jgi:hypothetical protein
MNKEKKYYSILEEANWILEKKYEKDKRRERKTPSVKLLATIGILGGIGLVLEGAACKNQLLIFIGSAAIGAGSAIFKYSTRSIIEKLRSETTKNPNLTGK